MKLEPQILTKAVEDFIIAEVKKITLVSRLSGGSVSNELIMTFFFSFL